MEKSGFHIFLLAVAVALLAIFAWGILVSNNSLERQEWGKRLAAIEKKIERLKVTIKENRRKALNITVESQSKMLFDFAEYSDQIQKAEKYEDKALELQDQLNALILEKRALIRQHSKIKSRQ